MGPRAGERGGQAMITWGPGLVSMGVAWGPGLVGSNKGRGPQARSVPRVSSWASSSSIVRLESV